MDKEFKNSSDQFAHVSHVVAASCYMLDEIAMFVFADAHEQLLNSKHYKHYIKYLAKECKVSMDVSESNLYRILDKVFFEAYADKGNELYQKHIFIMRQSIKREIDKFGIVDSDLLSYVEVSRLMIDYSCKFFDKLMTELEKKYKIDYTSCFKAFRMSRALDNIEKLSVSINRLLVPDSCKIDLNTEECIMAFNIIDKQINDKDNLIACILEAEDAVK